MKFLILLSLSTMLSLGLTGCSLLGFKSKRPPEVVPSCFSDGENQELYCKSQRTNEEGKIVVTRCIGVQNKEAKPSLRGKCVEKICSEGSNTDCLVKGEFAVLEQYAELATSRLFVDDETQDPKARKVGVPKDRGRKGALLAATGSSGAHAIAEESSEPFVDTSTLPPEKSPEAENLKLNALNKKGSAQKSSAAKEELRKEKEDEAEPPSMSITLKPVKPKKKSRSVASVGGDESGFKKACVPKRQKGVPETLRGKCATRNCVGGKCTYKGRKEIFDWIAKQDIKDD